MTGSSPTSVCRQVAGLHAPSIVGSERRRKSSSCRCAKRARSFLGQLVKHLTNFSAKNGGAKWFLQEGSGLAKVTSADDRGVGIAGHKQYADARPHGSDLIDHLAPIHAGHDDVGQDQMNLAGVLAAKLNSGIR